MVVSISKIPDRIQRDLYSGMFSNYGYFRAGSDQYIGAIASESTTEVGKKAKEEYNTLEK
jgi:hypothetical protein